MVTNYQKGLLMALGTALFWGASSSVAKLISAQGVHQLTVMVYRAIFVFFVVGAWILHRRGREAFRLSGRLCAIYAVLGFLTLVCMAGGYMMSCVYLSVPQAVILHFTFPIPTILGDIFITRERPTPIQIAASLLIVLGLYVGFAMDGGLGTLSFVGLAWGLLSVFGFAAQTLTTRYIVKGGKTDPIVQLFYTHVFGGIMVFIGKSLFFGWSDLSAITPIAFALMQYPATMGGMFAFALLFSSMKYIPATTASLVCTLEIVLALAMMPLLLGELPTPHETAGSLIILFAVAISTLRKKA